MFQRGAEISSHRISGMEPDMTRWPRYDVTQPPLGIDHEIKLEGRGEMGGRVGNRNISLGRRFS